MPAFDPGPPAAWEALFDLAPLDHYINHPSGRFRTDFGPVYYRGRLDGSARVLVIGQDPSTDEILAQRILVGEAGQRVQGLLRKLGLVQDYVLFNAFLFGITGQFDTQMRNVSTEAIIRDYRNDLLDQVASTNTLMAVLAFGAGAQHAANAWPGHTQFPLFKLVHPTSPSGVTASWNASLQQLIATIPAEAGLAADPTPYGAAITPADRAAIPRSDLPFALPSWHGSGGTHSRRQQAGHEIVWSALPADQ